MKKNILTQIKEINYRKFAQRNRYGIISVVILIVYFYATFSAVSFLVKNMRLAFSIDDNAAKNQIVKFNLEKYEKIKARFGE